MTIPCALPRSLQAYRYHPAPSASSRPVRGRLAPSPTGYMHLGNAWAFLLVHDSTRCQSRQEMTHIAQLYMMPFGKVIGNAAFQCSKQSFYVSGSKTGCL